MLIRFACLLVLVLGCASFSACGGPSQAHNSKPQPLADPTADSDTDGIPDKAELRTFEDRKNFRRWFAAIAERQFYRPSDEWNLQQRDCSGLIRFSLREALRKHDRQWFQKMGAEYEHIAPDVKAFSLETNPLGEKLFRTAFGSFQEGDVASGKFDEFADARTLKNFNCVFISRERRDAEQGDLLFFHQPWVQKFPYHAMLFIAEPVLDGEGAADWVVYHTGSSPTDDGSLKKVRLSVLDHHPDKRWRPISNNPHFLGFYRLKMLD